MTGAIEAVRLKGPGGREYEVQEDWFNLPHGWTACDVPGVTIGPADRPYLITRGNCPYSKDHPVIVLEPDGTFVRSFGEGLFELTHAIAFGVDGLLYCTDSGGHRIQVFTPEGELKHTIAGPVSPSDTGYTNNDFRTISRPAGPFNMPTKMVTAANGDLFASDGYGNARVHRFSPRGDLQASWGRSGDQHGAFHVPHSVLVLPDQRILVCDRENSRIQVFDLDGNFLEQWTDLARPDDVAVDVEGNLYVAELGERATLYPWMHAPYGQDRPGRVSVLDRRGNALVRWGDDPAIPLEFTAPHGIAVDSRGNVYVSEVRQAAQADPATWHKAVRKFVRIA